jgi:hypothetical protein
MDLLERYLQSVRTHLPKSQQDDIIKELSENLRSQIEDQESGLGRPLSEDELAVLLKKHGHPLFVATRYRQSRHLIGSTLFPIYWLVMRVILVIMAFSYGIAALVMLAQSNPILHVLGAAFSFVGAVLPTFAWVTIVFAVLDIGNTKFRFLEKLTRESNDKFDPRTLPPLRSFSDFPDARPISRYMTAFELFFSVAFLLWWIRVNPIRQLALFLALGPVGLADKIPFQLGPVWNIIYVPVILLALISIFQQIVNLIHPHWIKFYAVTRLLTNVGSLVLFYFLFRVSEILVLAPSVANASKFIEPLRIVNLTLHYCFLFGAAAGVFECFKQIRRLFRVRRNPAMSPAL